MEKVLEFWFDYASHPEPLYTRKLWWERNQNYDDAIRKQFFKLREDAIAGRLDSWLEGPRGTLAYIILLDQFSRNLLRGTPQMYQSDHLALRAASEGIRKKYDQDLSFTERVFLYMPFEHSEDLQHQQQSVQLFNKLVKEVPSEVTLIAQNYLKYAEDHYEVIKKFHRFPHRNKILGRLSTEEEKNFLKMHQGW